MKPNIHPAYKAAHAACACGAKFETRSAGGDMHLDICSMCHPFFTGKQKLMDTEGRIDRFKKKYAKTVAMQAETAARTETPKA